jgi:ribosomal protein S18 acetylase RimI-like enzyme
MEIKKLETEEELNAGFHILKELRKDLNEPDFREVYKNASFMDGYCLVGAVIQSSLVGVMGYRLQYDFVRKKFLYIDDLVTTVTMRSKGIGAQLLQYAEKVAKDKGCSVVRLSAHIDNKEGQKFYERESWYKRSIGYQKNLNT